MAIEENNPQLSWSRVDTASRGNSSEASTANFFSPDIRVKSLSNHECLWRHGVVCFFVVFIAFSTGKVVKI